MTDGEKPRQRKKVPKLQELDDMPEGGTGKPVDSGKGKSSGSKTNRRQIRRRKGVGQNKKVVKAPRAEPKPKPASKSDKAETPVQPPADSSSKKRVTSVKVKKVSTRSPKKSPEPRSSGDGAAPPRIPPPPTTPPQPSEYPSHDKYACAMAFYESEKQGHQMEPFEELPNDGGRDRAYKSKCDICDRRAIASVQYLEGYTDAMGQSRWYGDATKVPCSPKPSRKPVAKNEPKARPEPKSVKQEKLSASFEVPLPSWDGILEATAQDEARRAANDKDRRHRVKVLFPISYPKAGKDSIYQGKCERCRRKVFGKVQRFPGEPGKSERILVYGDALQYPCSGARAKR